MIGFADAWLSCVCGKRNNNAPGAIYGEFVAIDPAHEEQERHGASPGPAPKGGYYVTAARCGMLTHL